jgi:hypothetical protein
VIHFSIRTELRQLQGAMHDHSVSRQDDLGNQTCWSLSKGKYPLETSDSQVLVSTTPLVSHKREWGGQYAHFLGNVWMYARPYVCGN